MKGYHQLLSLILCAAILGCAQARPLLNRCVEEAAPGSCRVCRDGFYAHNGECLPQSVDGCLEYFPNVNHCKRFKDQAVTQRRLSAVACLALSEGVCNLCPNLYIPSPSNPEQCIPITSNYCTSSDGYNDVCNTCQSGYYPLNGICTPQSKPNCLAYRTNQNYCTSCSSPLLAIAGSCVSSNAGNCVNYNPTTNICGKCATDYLNFNGGCRYAFDANCSTKTSIGVLCAVCNPGFYPNAAQVLCVPQSVPNCNTYQPNTNTCTACNLPLVVSGGVCIVFSLPNCANPNPATLRCTQCNPGFYINTSTGLCIPVSDPNCGASNGVTNVCTGCKNLYYKPLGASCAPIDEVNCVTNVPNQNLCAVCVAPYVPSVGICVCNGTVACLQANPASPSRCLLCSLGCAVNNNGFCQNNAVLYCKDYSFQTGRCSACTAPRILNPCSNTCVLSFTPNPVNINNCVTQCAARCVFCQPGFVPSADGSACVSNRNYSLQIVESGQFLVMGASTSPLNHNAQFSLVDPALSNPSNAIRINESSGVIKISPSLYAAYLTATGSGVVEVTPAEVSNSGSEWSVTPVPNTLGYFQMKNLNTNEYITSWTSTGGSPGVTVKFIPRA